MRLLDWRSLGLVGVAFAFMLGCGGDDDGRAASRWGTGGSAAGPGNGGGGNVDGGDGSAGNAGNGGGSGGAGGAGHSGNGGNAGNAGNAGNSMGGWGGNGGYGGNAGTTGDGGVTCKADWTVCSDCLASNCAATVSACQGSSECTTAYNAYGECFKSCVNNPTECTSALRYTGTTQATAISQCVALPSACAEACGDCAFKLDECDKCLAEDCTPEYPECQGDETCNAALESFRACLKICGNSFVCDGALLAIDTEYSWLGHNMRTCMANMYSEHGCGYECGFIQ